MAAHRSPLAPRAGIPRDETHQRALRWAQTTSSSCQPLAKQPGTQAPSRRRGLGERPPAPSHRSPRWLSSPKMNTLNFLPFPPLSSLLTELRTARQGVGDAGKGTI